jgi:hypothetical protein
MTRLALDHLVIAAASLEQGSAWCRQRFGIEPVAGGRHAFMGTHNRLVRLAGDDANAWPQAYLEIIAIDPAAAAPARPRWFGLDEPTVQAAIAVQPRLVHWVARDARLTARRAAWAAAGFDPGPIEATERETPEGPLRWRITVPPEGRPPGGAALPALIAWDEGRHPSLRLDGAAALRLHAIELAGLPQGPAFEAIWPAGARLVPSEAGGRAGAALRVVLAGRLGEVRLASDDRD